MNYGLFEYTTVYTREPNFHSDGSSLTNVNTATQARLQTFFQNEGVSSANTIATSIYRSIHPARRAGVNTLQRHFGSGRPLPATWA